MLRPARRRGRRASMFVYVWLLSLLPEELLEGKVPRESSHIHNEDVCEIYVSLDDCRMWFYFISKPQTSE